MSRVVTVVSLLLALGLWVPLALTTTPFSPKFALWPFEVGLGAVALVLLALTKPDLEHRRAPGLLDAALRSGLGAVFVGVGTWCHILAGGGAWGASPSTFVETGAVLGVLLGPLAVFENRAAMGVPSKRSVLVAALLTGWGTFLAILVGWVQAHYFAAILDGRDAAVALSEVKRAAWWLTVDPPWTLQFFGWVAIPLAALAWTRLRGWGLARQVAFALAVCGAVWPLLPGAVPVVTFGLSYLPIALPIELALVDLLVRRFGRTPSDEPAEPDRLARAAWVFALVMAILAALGLAGREGYRAVKRRELAREVVPLMPGFRKELPLTGKEKLHRELARVRHVVTIALVVSQTPVREDARRSVEDLLARIDAERRRTDLLFVRVPSYLESVAENGDGIEKDNAFFLRNCWEAHTENKKDLAADERELRDLLAKLELADAK